MRFVPGFIARGCSCAARSASGCAPSIRLESSCMANPEPLSELAALRPSHLVLEAFLVGEAVSRAEVGKALADAEAREHFLDLVALRGGVAAMGPSVWSAPEPASSWSAPRWWAAAAVVVFSVATGFFAGQRTVDASAAVEIGRASCRERVWVW